MTYYSDVELVNLYSEWSEEYYAAGFLIPDESRCRDFVRWLNRRDSEGYGRRPPWESYEREMLERVRPMLASAPSEPTEKGSD